MRFVFEHFLDFVNFVEGDSEEVVAHDVVERLHDEKDARLVGMVGDDLVDALVQLLDEPRVERERGDVHDERVGRGGVGVQNVDLELERAVLGLLDAHQALPVGQVVEGCFGQQRLDLLALGDQRLVLQRRGALCFGANRGWLE